MRFEGAVNYGAASTKQEQLLSVLAAFYKSFLTIFLDADAPGQFIGNERTRGYTNERGYDELRSYLGVELNSGVLLIF